MKSIDFDDFEPESVKPAAGEQELAKCEEFRLRKLDVTAQAPLKFGANEEPRILSVVEGSIKEASDGSIISRGANVILPYNEAFEFVAEGEAKVIITDQFA